jgi:hypothetical protein
MADIHHAVDKITNASERFCCDFNHKLHYFHHQLQQWHLMPVRDVPGVREDLLQKITHMLNSCIMSSIHGGIAAIRN